MIMVFTKEKGQGLVEFALVFVFLLVLVAGIAEVGVLLNRQITVVNAAREGARFGAYGATAENIHAQTLLATSQMFEFTEENAVVAVINATTDGTGMGFTEWITNTYPITATVPHVTDTEVLAELRAEGTEASCQQVGQPCPSAADLKLVVVDVRYDHESMLGLPFVGAAADQIPIGSWTVMRVSAPRVDMGPGCCALPITFPMEDLDGLSIGAKLVDIRFGWLFWDPDNNGINLEANLRNRCNAGQKFEDACDGSRELTSGSWVSGVPSEMMANDVRDEVTALMGGYYPIPVWDEFEACEDTGCYCNPGTKVIHIVGFALMEITEVKLTGDPKTISAKFRGWHEGCN